MEAPDPVAPAVDEGGSTLKLQVLTVEMRDIREATRVVSEGFSREYMRECIDNHQFPQEAWEALGEYGLLGITIPEDLGGSGGGQVELVALMETLAEAGLVLPMHCPCGSTRDHWA